MKRAHAVGVFFPFFEVTVSHSPPSSSSGGASSGAETTRGADSTTAAFSFFFSALGAGSAAGAAPTVALLLAADFCAAAFGAASFATSTAFAGAGAAALFDGDFCDEAALEDFGALAAPLDAFADETLLDADDAGTGFDAATGGSADGSEVRGEGRYATASGPRRALARNAGTHGRKDPTRKRKRARL